MGETVKVDTAVLQSVADSLFAVRNSVENVVDTLPSIKRMSEEAWPGDGEVGGIFEENCRKLRLKCVELMVNMEKRKKMVDGLILQYADTDSQIRGFVGALSADGIFQ